MEKRGIGHIEVILAFILFIGAISFAFYYFNPIKQDISFSQSSDKTLKAILENVSTEVISYSVYINGSVTPAIGSKLEISLSDVPGNMNSIAESYSGSSIGTIRTGTDRFCLKKTPAWNNDFIYLKLGEEFVSTLNPGDCTSPKYDLSYFKVSSRDTEEIPSEKRMLSLNSSYYSDYGKLKNNLGIRQGSDFGFTFNFADGKSINAQGNIPEGLEVFSETRKMEVLRKNGKIEFGELIIKTW